MVGSLGGCGSWSSSGGGICHPKGKIIQMALFTNTCSYI